ncbi:hypothetical protein Emed_003628 [Eimeria media]
MQPGVCDYIGLKKLKRKYDLVIQALKAKGNQAELLTKAEEKEKIVSARLLAVSCLMDKNALRTLSKYIRLSIEGMGNPEADKAAVEMNTKRVLAYEAVAKECNATDELQVMEKLKQSQAVAKEADAAESAETEGEEEQQQEEDNDDDNDNDEE